MQRFCRLCECPVVDGGVLASEIDLDKFDDWCLHALGTKLADDLFEDEVFCNFCKWDAEWDLSLSGGYSSLAWWPIQRNLAASETALKSYYLDGMVTPCWVKLDKLFIPENGTEEEKVKVLKEEHLVRYIICIYCGKKVRRGNCKKHMLEVHKVSLDRCEVFRCMTYFHSLEEKKLHMQEVHEKQKMFTCTFCAKVFRKVITYRLHVKNVHSLNAHKCIISKCVSYFHTKEELNSHFRLMHEKYESEKIFKCENCNFKTIRKAFLQAHILRNHLEKTIGCAMCPKVFSSKGLLKIHLDLHHSFRVCKLCQLNVKVGNFRWHSMEQLCARCKKEFPCSGKLQAHKKICKETKIQCENCPKIFKNLSQYNYHMQLSHSKGAPHLKYEALGFKCEHCKKFFSSSRSLEQHLKFANNTSSFVSCDHCSKKFGTIHGLKIHLAEKHNFVMNCKHKCLVCAKKFALAHSLRKHILHSHSTMSNQYKNCQLCGNLMKVLQMSYHMLRIHGIGRKNAIAMNSN